MKTIFLIISAITFSFSISKAQGLPRTVKEWCLAINEQNKEMSVKLLGKDSIIATMDTLVRSKEFRIKSYERDSVSSTIQIQSLQLITQKYDTIVQIQQKEIRKTKAKLRVSGWTLITLALVALVAAFD